MKPKKTVQTPYRFFYLNAYAFLLLFVGGCIGCIPLYAYSLWWLLPQCGICLLCLYEAMRIFSSWADKKRKYAVLMQRNAAGIRVDTFTDYMQAPCGRLLVRVVLIDLHHSEIYPQLRSLRKPWRENLKTGCRPQPTVIHTLNSPYREHKFN